MQYAVISYVLYTLFFYVFLFFDEINLKKFDIFWNTTANRVKIKSRLSEVYSLLANGFGFPFLRLKYVCCLLFYPAQVFYDFSGDNKPGDRRHKGGAAGNLATCGTFSLRAGGAYAV